MRKDVITSLLMLGVAFVYYRYAGEINSSALADDFGAAGLPVVYAYALAVLGGALLAKVALVAVVSALRGGSAARETPMDFSNFARAAGLLAIGAAYIAVVSIAGYLLSLIAVIGLVAWYQGEPVSWRLSAIAMGGGVAFYVFFGLVLGIDMPAGFWPVILGST